MEGPHDPHQPDAGATEPEAQESDLHALLERLLGQGDVRAAEPGAADALWPDLFPAATATPDDVSTIVPALEALPGPVTASVEAGRTPARAWEPVVIDSPAESTNVDDIHAAILASVSVDLEPIAEPSAPEPAAGSTADAAATEAALAEAALIDTALIESAPTETVPTEVVLGEVALTEALLAEAWPTEAWPTEVSPTEAWPIEMPSDAEPTAALPDVHVLDEAAFAEPIEAAEPVVAAADVAELHAFELTEPAAVEPVATVDLPAEVELTPISSDFIDSLFAADPTPLDAVEPEAAPAAFSLTPFDDDADGAAVDMGLDVEALWAAALPELGLEAAPLLDLDDDQPSAPTAVVLPWPSSEPKAEAPAPQDLIEAALSGVHADLTAEAVEPLRTPDVAAATAHVVFRLGGRIMAIPLAAVSEIARPPRTTRLPHVPAWVIGIANLRGDIVSMLDLEGFFSGKTGKTSHEQRMLALRPAGDEVRTAVLVDAVDGIQAFEDARISRVTRGYDAEVSPYARGLYQMEDELIVVLDADRLLQSKPMRQFEDGAGAR